MLATVRSAAYPGPFRDWQPGGCTGNGKPAAKERAFGELGFVAGAKEMRIEIRAGVDEEQTAGDDRR